LSNNIGTIKYNIDAFEVSLSKEILSEIENIQEQIANPAP